MLTVDIPGRGSLTLSHLVLDYNGTIALDGEIIDAVRSRLEVLAKDLTLWVITADTHGTAAEKCKGLPVQLRTFPTVQVGEIKAACCKELAGGVVCVGNGFNDIPMAEVCDLSIAVIGPEGCCGALLTRCDMVVTSIEDALDLLRLPHRLRATLRT